MINHLPYIQSAKLISQRFTVRCYFTVTRDTGKHPTAAAVHFLPQLFLWDEPECEDEGEIHSLAHHSAHIL